MDRELSRKRDKINDYNNKVYALKTSLNELVGEKLEIEKELQERKQLEEHQEELEEKNDALAVEIHVRTER